MGLASSNLLVVAPHFKFFIEDQTRYVQPFFKKVEVILPAPRFSGLVTCLPYFGSKYSFLRNVLSSDNSLISNSSIEILKAPYLALPVDVIQKREHHLVSQAVKTIIDRKLLDFDLVHAHFVTLGYAAAKLKEKYGKPFVITAHGGDVYNLPFSSDWNMKLAKFALSNADGVITVSRENIRKLRALGVPDRKLHLIPNGYDDVIFKPVPKGFARKRLSVPAEAKILLSVGNLQPVKGHSYLVDALSIVSKRNNNVILFIIGAGPLDTVLKQKIVKLGLQNNVFLLGAKNHQEIPLWMNACDLFVLPSLNEGFATVLPEAMACGKPIVATNVGGASDALADAQVGVLVDPQNAEKLAMAILQALEIKWASEVIVNYAKRYSWGKIVDQILSVYEGVL